MSLIYRKPTAMNTIIIVTLLLVGIATQYPSHNSENEDSPNQEFMFPLSHKTLDANSVHTTRHKNMS